MISFINLYNFEKFVFVKEFKIDREEEAQNY